MQVRKSYEEKRRRRKVRGEQRAWKLKRMAMELEEEPGTTGRGRDARNAPRHEQDLERFMQVSWASHAFQHLPMRLNNQRRKA